MDDFNAIKEYIKNNHSEVTAILDAERLNLVNAPEIKILMNDLNKFWNTRPNKKLSYIFYFSEAIICNLNFNSIITNLKTIVTPALKNYRVLEVDENFNLISQIDRDISANFLVEISNNGKIAFFLGENGIDIAARGEIIPRINIFYDDNDKLQYYKKYKISDLQACLKEYELYINKPGINEAFFANKVLIQGLRPINPPLNTLINKPENTLRNNLKDYLNRNTQHDFTKEIELDNKRELDLYTEVDGKIYLIEVKWLGQTINDSNTGFSQRKTDVAAREGVTQTLEYIQHLIEKMRYNVHCGYLCVFDARDNKKAINYDGYNFIKNELLIYYKTHFQKLDEISLDRSA